MTGRRGKLPVKQGEQGVAFCQGAVQYRLPVGAFRFRIMV
jgi:hypothetical protein